jgi:hypothetical protein
MAGLKNEKIMEIAWLFFKEVDLDPSQGQRSHIGG